MGIELFRGDITTLSVDAIVNAANSNLTPGGAVGLAIHRAAGPELQAECMKIMRGVFAGDAVATKAYRLSAKFVFHAVGPSWMGEDNGRSEALARTYRRCFALAEEHGVRSIAFPAISCGLFRFPVRLAAQIAVREAAAALRADTVERVIFALFTQEIYDAFDEALRSA